MPFIELKQKFTLRNRNKDFLIHRDELHMGASLGIIEWDTVRSMWVTDLSDQQVSTWLFELRT
jgi:hypothetical protein